MKKILLVTVIFLSLSQAWAAPAGNLEDELKNLELPPNRLPAAVTKEKFYSVQERYSPLKFRSEITLGGAQNLTGDSFLVTRETNLGYRFHVNNRWSLGLSHSFVSNQFTSAGERFLNTEGFIPDVPYARNRSDLTVAYNVFYGKFRLSSDQIFYFDQYLALGPGVVEMNTGTYGAAIADAGLALWLGRWGSARVGFKDYLHNEAHRTGTSLYHNVHAHLDVGYLF